MTSVAPGKPPPPAKHVTVDLRVTEFSAAKSLTLFFAVFYSHLFERVSVNIKVILFYLLEYAENISPRLLHIIKCLLDA